MPDNGNQHGIAKCHAAPSDGGEEGPAGPSEKLRSRTLVRCPQVRLRSSLKASWHRACHLPSSKRAAAPQVASSCYQEPL